MLDVRYSIIAALVLRKKHNSSSIFADIVQETVLRQCIGCFHKDGNWKQSWVS